MAASHHPTRQNALRILGQRYTQAGHPLGCWVAAGSSLGRVRFNEKWGTQPNAELLQPSLRQSPHAALTAQSAAKRVCWAAKSPTPGPGALASESRLAILVGSVCLTLSQVRGTDALPNTRWGCQTRHALKEGVDMRAGQLHCYAQGAARLVDKLLAAQTHGRQVATRTSSRRQELYDGDAAP